MDVEIYVVGNKQIELAIVVIIDKSRAGGPARIGNPGALCDVGKRSLTRIPKQAIRPQARYINIDKTVVIVIAGRDSHTPATTAYTCLVVYVLKRAVTVIVIESTPGFLIGFHHVGSKRVNKVYVQIAIVVVIQEGHASTHRFDYVFFFRRGYVLERYTGLLGNIGKLDRNRLLFCL